MPGTHTTRQFPPGTGTESGLVIHPAHTMVDAAEQAHRQHWVDLEIHQLSAGAYQGSFTNLSSDNLHVVHEHQNQLIHKTGMMPKNSCTVSMAFSSDPAMQFSHFHNPEASWLFFLPQETEFDVKVAAGVETLYVCIEQDRLIDGARTLNERYWEKPPKELHAFNTHRTCSLAAELSLLLQNAPPCVGNANAFMSTPCGTMLVDSLLLALNSATEILSGDTPDYHAYRRSGQLLKTAREFIDATLAAGQIPSIVDICRQLGVSERTLQYAFQHNMQLTPVAYLRIRRLNKVRTALLSATSPHATVTHIATAWGFVHLGKFSQDYRRMFGERPSDTLARSCIER